MKFAFALCLLLNVGFSAIASSQDINFMPFLKLQERVMKSLISTQAMDETDLLNDCFSHYMVDQRGVMNHYNQMYSGCIATSKSAKDDLTTQSNEQRAELLSRTDNMCSGLKSCEELGDGMDFFGCYRDASTNSYKVMFTLNNDANVHYNTISSKYAVIDAEMQTCTDEARMEYAQELEECDSYFQDCMAGKAYPQPEEPKPEEPQPEEPKPEEPQPEEPKPEEPQPEEPKPEEPQPEEPKPEEPQPEEPKPEEPQPEEPKPEEPQPEEPKPEEPQPEEPQPEEPQPEEPQPEEDIPDERKSHKKSYKGSKLKYILKHLK